MKRQRVGGGEFTLDLLFQAPSPTPIVQAQDLSRLSHC